MSQRRIHPAGAASLSASSAMQVQEGHPAEMQDPWLYMYHIHSTDLAKAREKEVQPQTPISRKGDGISEVS